MKFQLSGTIDRYFFPKSSFLFKKIDQIFFELAQFTKSYFHFSCDIEYIDIYSDLQSAGQESILQFFPSRFCGTVAPSLRVRHVCYLN
jgi:hypothetical protein